MIMKISNGKPKKKEEEDDEDNSIKCVNNVKPRLIRFKSKMGSSLK